MLWPCPCTCHVWPLWRHLVHFQLFPLLNSTIYISTKILHIPGDQNTRAQYPCTSQGECGEGTCNVEVCKCTEGWINYDGKPCSYALKSKFSAFIISFLFGPLGADWFYLARGSIGYIIAGIFKLLTLGGFGIWYLIGNHWMVIT